VLDELDENSPQALPMKVSGDLNTPRRYYELLGQRGDPLAPQRNEGVSRAKPTRALKRVLRYM